MPRVSLAFFTAAAVCGLTGMIWGLAMAIGKDHTTLTGHAHLNLVGWVGMAIMGTFYGLLGEARIPRRLAWVNFWLTLVGVAMMAPALGAIYKGVAAAEPLAAVGSLISFAGMLAFVAAVFRAGRPGTVPAR
jgi:cbb3-type cytochrome oxidase subunit 1